MGGVVLRQEANPLLRLRWSSWDDFLSSKSPNLRQQVRRLERKLVREHGLRYRMTRDRSSLDEDLDVLFRLHGARWANHRSRFGSSEAPFHHEFASRAFDQGWLRLWFLEADGRPVAAWLGYRFAGSGHYYQAGRGPEWQGPSVGLVLLAHTIRAALDDGVSEYRFLRGGEPFKYRFADEDLGLETIGVPRGALGRVALRGGATLPGPVVLSVLGRLAHTIREQGPGLGD